MDFITSIIEKGGRVFLVGGVVRDLYYNFIYNTKKEINDIDILVSNIKLENLIDVLKKFGKISEVGKSFGIISFVWKKNGKTYEIALPRRETSTGSGYRDFKIDYDSNIPIQDDFNRRDATINAMAIELFNSDYIENINELKLDKIIDYNGGENDIKNRLWRCVGKPEERFLEDPTRILRAIRQSVELDFKIEENTLNGIKSCSNLIKTLIPQSYVRLFTEILRMIKHQNYKNGISLLFDCNIIQNLQLDTIILNDNKDIIINKFKNIKKEDFLLKLCCLLLIQNLQLDTIILNDNKDIIINKFKNIKKEDFLLKLCCLLLIKNHDSKDIYNFLMSRQFTATNYISHIEVKILANVSKYFEKIINCKTLYNFLIFRHEIFKDIGDNNSVNICIELIYNYYNKHIDLIEYFISESKKYIISENELNINGNDIMNIINKKGEIIGKIKNDILINIFNNNLLNDKNEIIKFIKDKYTSIQIQDTLI